MIVGVIAPGKWTDVADSTVPCNSNNLPVSGQGKEQYPFFDIDSERANSYSTFTVDAGDAPDATRRGGWGFHQGMGQLHLSISRWSGNNRPEAVAYTPSTPYIVPHGVCCLGGGGLEDFRQTSACLF